MSGVTHEGEDIAQSAELFSDQQFLKMTQRRMEVGSKPLWSEMTTMNVSAIIQFESSCCFFGDGVDQISENLYLRRFLMT